MEKTTSQPGGETALQEQAFQELNRKLASGEMVWAKFRVKICGRIVELCFGSEELREPAMRSLRGHITRETGEPDAVFFYWYDSSREMRFVEKADGSIAVEGEGDRGYVGHQIFGFDAMKRHFYFTRPEWKTVDYAVYGPTLVSLFSRWASISDLMLLHSAAVGIDGKGVLVVGRGGRGKSTFSASCLAAGLDFVSDDYTLLSASGPLCAMPLYTTVSVNPDMYAMLPELGEPSVPPDTAWCNGKLQFFVSPERLSRSLAIKAIIIPAVGPDESDPVISPSEPGAAMVQMLHSSVAQVGRGRDTALVRQMAQRLSGLPVYEMRMSRDLAKNPAALRRFIEKEF